MNISIDLPVSIYEHTKDGKKYYSLGLFKKGLDNNYVRGFINCQFKKDLEINTDKKIYIKKAWLTFYLKDKITVPYIFINEFEYVEDVIKQNITKNEGKDLGKEVDPFEDFANEVEIKDEDLPF